MEENKTTENQQREAKEMNMPRENKMGTMPIRKLLISMALLNKFDKNGEGSII